MAGVPDWGGTPAATGDIVAVNVQNVVLAEAAQVSYQVTVTRPAYAIRLETWNATDHVTALPVSITMSWGDTQSNFSIDDQVWWIYAGDSAHTAVVRGRGPTDGDGLVITITNQAGSAVNLEFNLLVVEADRQALLHDWRTDEHTFPTFPGFTLATNDLQSNVLVGEFGLSVNASTTTPLLMPLYAGPAWFYLLNSGAGGTSTMSIYPQSNGLLNPSLPLFNYGNASGFVVPQKLVMPRSQCVLKLQNTAAVAQTLTCTIIAENL